MKLNVYLNNITQPFLQHHLFNKMKAISVAYLDGKWVAIEGKRIQGQ